MSAAVSSRWYVDTYIVVCGHIHSSVRTHIVVCGCVEAATRKEAQQGERLLHMLVGKYVASRSHPDILVSQLLNILNCMPVLHASDTVCFSMCVILLPIQSCTYILGP